jgi:hypothetical protein
MSSIDFLNAVSTQFSIYFGIFTLVAGVIGDIFNLLVFLSLKTFRENSCAFYLTAMSFLDICQLMLSLFPRIMNLWFAIDWTVASLAYCKIRAYCFQVCSLTSFTCMCLATIDQFLATCTHTRWQRFGNINFAYRCFIIAVIIWLLHGIPILIYQDQIISSMTGNLTCVISNKAYQSYYTYGFTVVLISGLPVLATALFGLLAYRNVIQLAYRAVPLVRRELDKQLTVMVLVQVIFNCCVLVPYIVLNITNLGVSLSKISYSYAQLQLGRNITISVYYWYFAVSVNHRIEIPIHCIFFYFYLGSILYIFLCIGKIS